MSLLLLGFLFFEMLLQVVGDGPRVLLQVHLSYHRTEDFLFTNNTRPEIVVLVRAVGYFLAGALGLPHQVLTVGQVTANLPAYHHGQLIYRQFWRGSIVPPIVVISSTYGVELIRVFLLDDLLPDAILDLKLLSKCKVHVSKAGWVVLHPCFSCSLPRTPLSFKWLIIYYNKMKLI